MRNKRDLIESLSVTAEVHRAWAAFWERKRTEELDAIIADEGLDVGWNPTTCPHNRSVLRS